MATEEQKQLAVLRIKAKYIKLIEIEPIFGAYRDNDDYPSRIQGIIDNMKREISDYKSKLKLIPH